MKKAVDNIAEDKAAVIKMKTGSEREKELAFTSLYNRYAQLMLFHIMRQMKGDRIVAEDLSQEVFTKAFQNQSLNFVRCSSLRTFSSFSMSSHKTTVGLRPRT